MADDSNATGARRFQLRPSILSGGGGFGNDTSAATKGFMLRPSALSAAADKIEDNRKRTHSSNDSDDKDDDNESKRNKTFEERPVTPERISLHDRLGVSNETEKLTGIGTFGFASSSEATSINNGHDESNGPASESDANKTEKGDFKTPNYFLQSFENAGGAAQFGGPSFADEGVEKDDEKGVKNDTTKADSNSAVDDAEGTAAAAATTEEKESSDGEGEETGTGLNDTESNRSILESRADEYRQTRIDERMTLTKEVSRFTGEEDEKHVLQIFCKLHLYNKEKNSWNERGRGNLNLNDIYKSEGVFQSRLVFRTEGAHNVLMNVLLCPEMKSENVNEKSLRISTVDPESKEVKIYLLTANKKDALGITQMINSRMKALRSKLVEKEKSEENYEEKKKDASTPKDSDSSSTSE